MPAYRQAAQRDYAEVHALQIIMTRPYAEQDDAIRGRYYALKPQAFFGMGGVSHMSCSS